MVQVSVIIPVYNAAMHLQECINSLLQQTFTACEFIFVNDGSTDESELIINNNKKNDNRIILINQKNQGVSVARNTGIEKAIGTFLSFVDADDTVEKDFLDNLITTALKNKVEIVTSNFNTQFKEKFIKSTALFKTDYIFNATEIKEKILPFFIEKDTLNTVWNKLYATDLIKSNHIIFPVGITNGEDGLFNIVAFSKSNTVLFTNYCGYNYKEVLTSATRTSASKDYFKIAVEKYNFDYKTAYKIEFPSAQLKMLQSKRLINQVISLIAIYFNNNQPFIIKYTYIKNMIYNSTIQQIVSQYWDEIYTDKSRYEQFILNCIKHKRVVLLFLANSYSNFRNK